MTDIFNNNKILILSETARKIPETDMIVVPAQMFDFYKVMEMGAIKRTPNNWLKADGDSVSHRDMHASMFRHLADSHAGITKDHESDLHPLLHLSTRALMLYTRQELGLTEKKDTDA